jgi:bifunctional polynucleotide phosphatase/kinase
MEIGLYDFKFRTKIASFDYDWTLVKPITNGTFSKNIDDVMWLNEKIPEILQKYYDDKYCIIIFTNQSKIFKIKQIEKFLKTLEIPMLIIIATKEEEKKPNTFMFDKFINFKWNVKKSFYCGDALGRINDWSNTDKLFANNIGIKCYSPEEIFPIETDKEIINDELENLIIDISQKIIIMVGYPGAGKTTITDKFKNDNYIIIHNDDFNSSVKMIKYAIPFIENNKSIIFDATNPTKEKREEFINLSKKYNIKSVCIHVLTTMEKSLYRNNLREKKIPMIAYYVYRKKFQEPTIEDGFNNIIII